MHQAGRPLCSRRCRGAMPRRSRRWLSGWKPLSKSLWGALLCVENREWQKIHALVVGYARMQGLRVLGLAASVPELLQRRGWEDVLGHLGASPEHTAALAAAADRLNLPAGPTGASIFEVGSAPSAVTLWQCVCMAVQPLSRAVPPLAPDRCAPSSAQVLPPAAPASAVRYRAPHGHLPRPTPLRARRRAAPADPACGLHLGLSFASDFS